jgi:hypothetical protein
VNQSALKIIDPFKKGHDPTRPELTVEKTRFGLIQDRIQTNIIGGKKELKKNQAEQKELKKMYKKKQIVFKKGKHTAFVKELGAEIDLGDYEK